MAGHNAVYVPHPAQKWPIAYGHAPHKCVAGAFPPAAPLRGARAPLPRPRAGIRPHSRRRSRGTPRSSSLARAHTIPQTPSRAAHSFVWPESCPCSARGPGGLPAASPPRYFINTWRQNGSLSHRRFPGWGPPTAAAARYARGPFCNTIAAAIVNCS